MSLLALAVALTVTPVDLELVDVSAIRAALVVAADGKQHFLAYKPDAGALFYGDGKVFFEVGIIGTSSSDEQMSITFWDPRFPLASRSFEREGEKLRVTCGKRVVEVKPLDTEAARPMLGAAVFKRLPFAHKPYALARDERGTYYFVDRGRWPENESFFRVFIGAKGNLKQAKLKNVVHDTEGDVFSTPKGDLRLVITRGEVTWVSGKNKREQLTPVPVEDNLPLIYNELGPYMGVRLGTPCDDV